jgi:catechol 2,3-dioxygenase-like lactoylglutathione lyase family enzyme
VSTDRTTLGLDHIVLKVSDVERTLAWYRDRFGLGEVRVAEWRAGSAPFPSLRVDAGTIIDLIAADHLGAGHLDHVCFVVDHATFTALGEDPLFTVFESGERYGARGIARSVYARDPDGLVVEARVYPG